MCIRKELIKKIQVHLVKGYRSLLKGEGIKKFSGTLKSEYPAQSDTWPEYASCVSCQRKRSGNIGTRDRNGSEKENRKMLKS